MTMLPPVSSLFLFLLSAVASLWPRISFSRLNGDPTTHGFIRSELEYEALEALKRQLQDGKDASSDCYTELKKKMQEVKQTLDTVVAELWKLEAQPAQLKPGLNPEL